VLPAKQQRIEQIIRVLRTATVQFTRPSSALIAEKFGSDPFLILIACLLSLRTKDTVSFPASCRLFNRAKTAHTLFQLPIFDIEKLIYPVGFYRKKAQTLHAVAQVLLEQYDGHVPNTWNELCALPGVGPKTANLVLSEAFGIPAICVDVHVHRISNRLGLVQSTTPQETEKQLSSLIPKKDWSALNNLFVMWGQNICVPVSPFCSKCPLNSLCPKIGVTKKR